MYYQSIIHQLHSILLLSFALVCCSSPFSRVKRPIPHSAVSPTDRFVTLSPLCIAATCTNGVVLIALHTSSSEDIEPLLLPLEGSSSGSNNGDVSIDEQGHDESKDSDEKENDNDKPLHSPKAFLQDLPLGTRGPLRIEPVDSYGSVILCSGWRVDSMTLADKCRQLAAVELERYGGYEFLATSAANDDDADDDNDYGLIQSGNEYAQYLARGLCSYMANCAFSENVRSLSSVALLATGGGKLHFIDATGAYPCRAFSIGVGSNIINQRLLKTDFSSLTCQECAKSLLNILKDCHTRTTTSTSPAQASDRQSDEDQDAESLEQETKGLLNLPPSTRAEIVFVDSSQRKMRRVRGIIPR